MMSECIDEGLLRTYLPAAGDMDPGQWERVERHLHACPACREQLAQLRGTEAKVSAHLASLAPEHATDKAAAWQTMQAALAQERFVPGNVAKAAGRRPDFTPRPGNLPNRRIPMQTIATPRAGVRRALFSGLAATLVLTSLAFPSVRAAADQILQTFRAQSAVFVGVDARRIDQILAMNVNPSSLFLGPPEVSAGTMQSMMVADYQEAAGIVGFTPERVNALPGDMLSEETSVLTGGNVSVTVDLGHLQEVISALNINDVSLPKELGAEPIKADILPSTYTKYTGSDYILYLAQGRSPTVHMPPGVELSQLGKAGLRVLGMNEIEADKLSKQIDWSTTLVVPFPAGVSGFKQVQVGNSPGLLVQSSPGALPTLGDELGPVPPGYQLLYWQQGDHFYVLAGTGTAAGENALLQAANSVK